MSIIKRKKHKRKHVKKSFTDYLIPISLMIIMIIISIPKTVLAQALFNFDGSEQSITNVPNAKIKLPNTEYTESTVDLSVKTLGGNIQINRTWENGRWYVNPAWTNLRFIHNPLDNSIQYIDRANIIFERTGDINLYRFDQVYIKKTDTGWQWYDRQGNWINYDDKGRITEYGNPNNVKVSFVLDNQGARTAVKDHHGELVYSFTYDTNDRLTQVKDRENRTVTYHWQGNLLVKVTDVLGNDWHYGYDSKGQLNQKTEPDGGIIKIEYTDSVIAPQTAMTSGKAIIQTSPTNVIKKNKYRTDLKEVKTSRVAKVIDKTEAVTAYSTQYNSTNKEYTITIIDPLGKKTVTSFNKEGKKKSTAVNGAVIETFTRDGDYLLKVTNQRGLTTTISYSQTKQPIKIIYPDGSFEQFEYNNLDQKTRHINQLGNITTWQYDPVGNLIKQVEAQGKPEQKVTTWTQDIYGQTTTNTTGDNDKAVTLNYSYDQYGNVKKYTDGNGNSYTYTHNIQGQITSKTDPLNNTWKTDYNLAGHIQQSIDPLNNITQYITNAMGQVTEMVDPLGYKTTYKYSFDNTGWKITQTDPLSQISQYYFNNLGHLTKTVSPSGLEATYVYDEQGRLKQQTDPAGNTISIAYGTSNSKLAGLVTKIIYPTLTQTYQYNEQNRPTQVNQILNDKTTINNSFSYDELGQAITITNPNNSNSTFEYNALGEIVKSVDTLGNDTKQTWDIFGNETQLVDAKGNNYYFVYDKNNNLIKETRALGSTIENTYNVANQLIQRKYTNGNIISYQYDKSGRKTQEIYTTKNQTIPSQTITYIYNKANQLIEVTQTGDTQTSFVYTLDPLGRIVKETITYGTGVNKIISVLKYTYNQDNNLASITYPDNSTVNYTYEKGQLKKTLLPNGETISWSDYQWGKPKKIQFPNATQTLQYDSLLRTLDIKVINQSNDILMARQYIYDLAGNIKQINTEKGKQNFQYDSLDRLIVAQPSQQLQEQELPIESYSYDEIGNRIGSTHQTGNWLYNDKNQLIQWGENQQKTILTYTENGHLASETTVNKQLNYIYNVTDRLVAINNADNIEIASYQYDPFGRRISKTVNGATTYFIYSDNGLIAELNDQGLMQIAYGWEPNTDWGTSPLWQANIITNNSAQYHYLHSDHLGTPQITTNSNGKVTWQSVSESFGKTVTNPNNQITMNLRFPGQYFDPETGLHYNYFRDYNPSLGRYIQSDPIGLDGDLNLFTYANKNPIRYTDPKGLFVPAIPIIICAGGACEAAGAAIAATMVFIVGWIWIEDSCSVSIPIYMSTSDNNTSTESNSGTVGGSGGATNGNCEPNCEREHMQRKPGQSGKEGAKDTPSWARGKAPYKGETPKQYADRLMKEQYGNKPYKTGPRTEHNRIFKAWRGYQ